MDIQQLINFKVLAEVANVTRAAEKLSLTQSALSKSIARLEDDIGMPLFERSRKGVTLNKYGKEFLIYAERAIQEIQEARSKINQMIDPSKGIISIGFIPTLSTNFIPNLIRMFLKEAPNIQFQLSQGSTVKILKKLTSGEIDIVFGTSESGIEHVQAYPLIKEELKLIVPKFHRFSERKSVALKEVEDEMFVHYQAGLTLRATIDSFCKEAGFIPKVTIEGSEDEIIAGLVEANCGVAIIPYTPKLENNDVVILSITEPKCERAIEMVWRDDRLPAVNQLRKFIITNLEELTLKYWE